MWKRALNHLEREKSNSLANQEKLTVAFGLERNAFEEIDICFVGGSSLVTRRRRRNREAKEEEIENAAVWVSERLRER